MRRAVRPRIAPVDPAPASRVRAGRRLGARDRTVNRPELLIDGSDEAFRALVYGLLTVAIRFDRLREKVGELIGLTGLQYHVLMVVAERDAGRAASVSDIALALHVTGAYATMEIAKLADKGLLTKRPNPSDRRGVLLALTPAGARAVAGMIPHLQEINDVLFAGLTSADFAAFRAIIVRMVGNTERSLAVADAILARRDAG